MNKALRAASLEPAKYQYKKYPWRGPAIFLDPRGGAAQPVEDIKVHIDIFHTASDEDMVKYRATWDLIGKGLAQLSEELKQQVDRDGKPGWLIMMRWAEVFMRPPDPYERHWQGVE